MTYQVNRPGRRLALGRRFKKRRVSANYVPVKRPRPFGLSGPADAHYIGAEFIPRRAVYRPDLPGFGPGYPGHPSLSSERFVGSGSSARYLAGPDDDGLGFSLKPPKFVRKAARFVKKNVTLKRALIAGAVVGAAFIPGVGPAALAAARAAGHGIAVAGRGLFRGAKAVGREFAAGFGQKGKPGGSGAGGSTGGDQGGDQGGGQPSGGGGGGYPSPTQPGGGYGGGDSGGGGTYGPTPVPGPGDSGEGGDESATAETESATPAPAQASAMPLLLGGTALLLLPKLLKGRG